MPFNYNISEYKYGYVSQWNGLAFPSTFIELHRFNIIPTSLTQDDLLHPGFTLPRGPSWRPSIRIFHQMFLQHAFFSSCASAAGDLGWDSVTALIDPRVTSLLLTFLWISEKNRWKTLELCEFKCTSTDTIHVFDISVRNWTKSKMCVLFKWIFHKSKMIYNICRSCHNYTSSWKYT